MRVGILGASHWHAGHHSAAIREAGAELAGVWDDDAAVAEDFASRQGVADGMLGAVKSKAGKQGSAGKGPGAL